MSQNSKYPADLMCELRSHNVSLKSALLSLLLFITLSLMLGLSGCGHKEDPIPDVRGQVITKEEAKNLEFEITSKIFDAGLIGPKSSDEVRESFDVEETLPRLHKWFTIGWGVRIHKFNGGAVIYTVRQIPPYVIEDLEKVLVPDYTPHVPLIVTAAFWRDMKILTENPLREVILGFKTRSMDAAVIHTAGRTLFLTFPLHATETILVHEGTHVRAAVLEKYPSRIKPQELSDFTDSCWKSVVAQVDELDAYYRQNGEISKLVDGVAHWYTTWSNEQLKSFIAARIRDPQSGRYQDDFGSIHMVTPATMLGALKLDSSCPTELVAKIAKTDQEFSSKNVAVMENTILHHPSRFYESIANDLSAYEKGGESCLGYAREHNAGDANEFFKLPACQKRFGSLRQLAQDTESRLEQDLLTPFFQQYLADFRDYDGVLASKLVSYQRLKNNHSSNTEEPLLDYLPKGLFN